MGIDGITRLVRADPEARRHCARDRPTLDDACGGVRGRAVVAVLEQADSAERGFGLRRRDEQLAPRLVAVGRRDDVERSCRRADRDHPEHDERRATVHGVGS